jgi:hypothetical protein
VTVVEGPSFPDESSAEGVGRPGSPAALPSAAAITREAPSNLGPEQPLVWGQWGGVIAIAAVLAFVVIVLTLTVGAIPL